MAAVLELVMMVPTPARHTTAAAMSRPVQDRPSAPATRLSSVRHGKLRLVLLFAAACLFGFSSSRTAQVITYEKADGWIMWTWKAESADDWSYQAGLQYGWIPQDPTDLKYSGICG